MAKKKKPTTESAEAVSTSSAEEIGLADAAPVSAAEPESASTDIISPIPSIIAVRLELPFIPVADDFGGYLTRHVEAQLDERQRRNLRGLINGLKASGERLATGRPIENHADAIKWLLEQIHPNQNGDA